MTGLTLNNIKKSYGRVDVLKGIKQTIDDGTFFTLLGPSGCGKTTLLRVVAGFVHPTGGNLLFGDEDVTAMPAHLRQTGVVFQDYALFPDKTVFENVAYGLRARSLRDDEINQKVPEYLERVGLAGLGERLPADMSGGQRQRVALARALIINPRVLLMDEPLSNLDASLRVQMRDVIRSLQLETKTTTIFVTHDQEEALAMSDCIAVMKDGRIDQCGAPDQVYRNPQTAYVADFVGSANLLPATHIGKANDSGDVFEVFGTKISGQRTLDASDDRYLLVARPENIKIQRSTKSVADHLIQGKVASLQFQGYRTNFNIALHDGTHITVDSFGESEASSLARGDDVELNLTEACLFVPDASR